MKFGIASLATILLAGMLSTVCVETVWAERDKIDRVVAMVDGHAILLSEVVQEMNLTRMQRKLNNLTAEEQGLLFDKILSDMVDDQLLVAQAKAKGYEVGEEEIRQAVDDQVRNIKSQLGGEENYRAELQKQGFTEAEVRDMHRERFQKQILVSRLVQQELRSKIKVTDNEVQSFFQTQRDSIPQNLLERPERIRLAHILLLPQASTEYVEVARSKANAALERLHAGEEFATVAREVSEWPTAEKGGFLGSFSYGDFAIDGFDEAISKLDPGSISEVIETQQGFMIIKLESRKGSKMTGRHIVVKLDPNEASEVRAFERAEEIKRRVDAGEDFAELAAIYSDDPISAAQGGEMSDEWVISDLMPQFKEALEFLKVGEVSKIVQSNRGFHLFKTLERKEKEALDYDELKPLLRRFVEQKKLDAKFQRYVKELRERFYVSIKS